MKFTYGYKTKDNVEREGEVCAPSRDDAFRLLKAQGIRPFRVTLAPGVLNRLQSYGKRTYAIVVLAALVIVAAFVIHANKRTIRTIEDAQTSPLPRHQIYGDPALMGELVRSNFAAVFDDPGLRCLAHFAQPGEAVSGKAYSSELGYDVTKALAACIDKPIAFADGEPREYRELKRTVLTMQAELKRYLSVGVGTPERYLRRLVQRQTREADIYYTARRDLENERNPEKWARINASLRAVGLKTIPLLPPEDGVTQKGENTPLTGGGKK